MTHKLECPKTPSEGDVTDYYAHTCVNFTLLFLLLFCHVGNNSFLKCGTWTQSHEKGNQRILYQCKFCVCIFSFLATALGPSSLISFSVHITYLFPASIHFTDSFIPAEPPSLCLWPWKVFVQLLPFCKRKIISYLLLSSSSKIVRFSLLPP